MQELARQLGLLHRHKLILTSSADEFHADSQSSPRTVYLAEAMKSSPPTKLKVADKTSS